MTKQDLIQCRRKRQELKSIESRINALRSDARSTKSVCYGDKPKRCGEPLTGIERYVEKLEELSTIYEERKTELLQAVIAVERAIADLPPDVRMLMQLRYIDGMRWEEVNTVLHISESTSKRLHKNAMRMLEIF